MKLNANTLIVGNLHVTFQRTLRLPEDDKTHALPPGLGGFPVKRVDDYKDKVPKSWRKHGGVFLPMYQREAMWLSFYTAEDCAVKVACGKVNAVSGQKWKGKLKKPKRNKKYNKLIRQFRKSEDKNPEQDYMVCPSQPWLDGFNTGNGVIRQFVAMPLGMGYTVEGQVTGKEKHGGIQIKVFPAKPGKLPKRNFYSQGVGITSGSLAVGGQYKSLIGYSYSVTNDSQVGAAGGTFSVASAGLSMDEDYFTPVRGDHKSIKTGGLEKTGAEMGLAAGGKMKQKIYEDPHGHKTWDQENTERVFVHIVNSEMYKQITGEDAPDTPVNAKTYTAYGYPWFDLYDEDKKDVQSSGTLAKVKPVSEKDAEHGFTKQQDDSSLDESKNVVKLGKKKKPVRDKVRDGTW